MAYQVVTGVVPGPDPETPDDVNSLQLDAPDGMFVTSTYWGVAGSGDGVSFQTMHPTAPGGGRPVIDGQGRVTGFVFAGAQMIEGVTSDIEVAIVCVT